MVVNDENETGTGQWTPGEKEPFLSETDLANGLPAGRTAEQDLERTVVRVSPDQIGAEVGRAILESGAKTMEVGYDPGGVGTQIDTPPSPQPASEGGIDRPELPLWKSHKLVQGFKIEEIALEYEGEDIENGVLKGAYLTGQGCLVFVSDLYLTRHNPQVGGYYVRYKDGYESWSPAEAFEDGNTRLAARQFNPQIEQSFTYHPPKGDQAERYVRIRDAGKELAYLIAESTPKSREQSLAFTNLDQTVMWANAAIARNE